MKTKYIYKLMWVMVLITTIVSCKKYIDLKPKDSTYDQVFWSNGANVDKALSGIYKSIRESFKASDGYGGGSYFVFGDLPTGAFTLGGDNWNFTTLVPDGGLRFSYAPYLESALQDWSRYYAIVNLCHLVIENTPKIADSKFSESGALSKKQLLGEGYLLRAFTYFYITKVWGDAVLTKESLKDPTNVTPLARSKEADVINYCIEDLVKAIGLLDYNAGTDRDKVRADKGAAQALLAQVYAWKHDYANAKKYCDALINSSNYELEPADTYNNIWLGGSQESIFEIFMRYDAATKESSAFMNLFLADPYIKNRSTSSIWTINKDFLEPLYSNSQTGEPETDIDIRCQKAYLDFNTGNAMLGKYANVNYYDPAQPATYAVDNNLVLIRLADIYLLKAEAEYKLGNMAGAQAALNMVKERAGLDEYTGTGDDLYEEITRERFRELTGEGTIAFDLIRMGKLGEYYPDIYSADRLSKKGYYWPLNMRTLLPQDPLLIQNEWWKNH